MQVLSMTIWPSGHSVHATAPEPFVILLIEQGMHDDWADEFWYVPENKISERV